MDAEGDTDGEQQEAEQLAHERELQGARLVPRPGNAGRLQGGNGWSEWDQSGTDMNPSIMAWKDWLPIVPGVKLCVNYRYACE